MPTFWQHLINFFFPINCLVCGQSLPADDQLRICDSCWQKIEMIKPLFCQKCGVPLPDGGTYCFHCRKGRYYFESIRAVCRYAGIVKECIHKFKYQNKAYLAKPLGKLLIDYLRAEPGFLKVDYLIPVPLFSKNQRKRGYNQTLLLAEEIFKFSNIPILTQNLRRIRKTKPQYELSREERKLNLIDAFAVANEPLIKGKIILLIDDICTTGSTINECAKALKKAQVKKVYGLVLARDY